VFLRATGRATLLNDETNEKNNRRSSARRVFFFGGWWFFANIVARLGRVYDRLTNAAEPIDTFRRDRN